MQVDGKLTDIGIKTHTDKAYYHKFTPVYERFLFDKKDTIKQMVEVGVSTGASIKMWDLYLPTSKILGLDVLINPSYKDTFSERVSIEKCDASNEANLISTFAKHSIIPGSVDLFIDDGSHVVSDQIKTFALGWKYVKSGGLYIIEDVHTSVQELIGKHPHMLRDYGWIDMKPETSVRVIGTMYGHKNLFPYVNEIEHIAYISNVQTSSLTCIFTKN